MAAEAFAAESLMLDESARGYAAFSTGRGRLASQRLGCRLLPLPPRRFPPSVASARPLSYGRHWDSCHTLILAALSWPHTADRPGYSKASLPTH